MAILVTGGTGYIGSHTSVELLKENQDIVIVDNFSNSDKSVLDKIELITKKRPKFYEIDLLDKEKLENVFKENKIEYVIHFAGFKAVGESVQEPIMYYKNNIYSTITLIEFMKKYNCKNLIFSSSATVYGSDKSGKCIENMGRGTVTNPYGQTKAMIEIILEDLYKSDNTWNIVILRYFNPIGAHETGLIGDNPNGIPNNLLPYIQKVASGELKELSVFGNDYNTHDGTGVRDYIHVVDLAKGHKKAIDKLNNTKNGVHIYNLGTGKGYSVLDIINNFEKENNIKIPYKIVERRPGDLDICYADAEKAKKELGWKAEKDLKDMVKDCWNFIKMQTNKQ